MNDTFKYIIKDICKEKNIQIKEFSFGYVLELKKDTKFRYIINHSFPLNSQSSGKLADDKFASYEILSSHNIPVIKQNLILNPEHDYNKSISVSDYWNDIQRYFDKYGKVVLKPNEGSNGIGVYLCVNIEDIKKVINENFKDMRNFLICPYYDSIAEYRTIFLNGECLLIYKKTKPFVTGDGTSTVKQLLESQCYIGNNKITEISENLDLNYIPKENEKYDISWKHNLSGGAFSDIIPDGELKNRIKELALKSANSLNMTFASVDIIHGTDDKLYIMEINSNIYMDKFLKQDEKRYPIVKDIYGKAIDNMFVD